MVLPLAQDCSNSGVDRSACLVKWISFRSARSAVWPPAVDAVALLGCDTPKWTEVHSIQPACASSADSPLIPSI